MEDSVLQINKKTYYFSISILAGIFFIIGFVSWANSILIPYFRISCELTHFESYFVTLAFYIAYFIMAIPSGILLKKVGFKQGLMCGFMFTSIGAFIFVPAALTRNFGIFLVGLFSIGTGLAILQTAANPYVTIIGPIKSAAKRMSIMGVCNKMAGIISPLLFAAMILKPGDKKLFALIESKVLNEVNKNIVLDELIQRIIIPYIILGIILLTVGICIKHSLLPEINTDNPKTSSEEKENNKSSKKNILGYPYLILGAIAIFFHVGSQVVSVDTIISYANSMGMDLIDAKLFPSYTLCYTLIGYLIGIVLIPRYISQRKALICCAIIGLILSLSVVLIDTNVTFLEHHANISIFLLNAIGLPNALIYASIWPLAIHDLGKFTKTGASLLVMGLCGNAIMPLLYGYFADVYDLRTGYWILTPCFIYILFFAVRGYKITSWKFSILNLKK